MLYRDTLLVVLRRWRISIPVALLSMTIGIGGYFVTPMEYKDQLAVLFLSSTTSDKDGPINPYMNLSSALIASADIIRLSASTPQAAQKLADQGATADYLIALDPSTPAPVLDITTSGSDPTVVGKTTKAVLALINDELDRRQSEANAAKSTWVRTTVVSSLDQPDKSGKSKLQTALVGSVGSFVLALILLFWLERRRVPHRETATSEPEHGADPPQGSDDVFTAALTGLAPTPNGSLSARVPAVMPASAQTATARAADTVEPSVSRVGTLLADLPEEPGHVAEGNGQVTWPRRPVEVGHVANAGTLGRSGEPGVASPSPIAERPPAQPETAGSTRDWAAPMPELKPEPEKAVDPHGQSDPSDDPEQDDAPGPAFPPPTNPYGFNRP